MQAKHRLPAGKRTLDRRARFAVFLALPCLLALSGCGNGTPASTQNGDDPAALPGPAPGKGSVTGMPDKPGPGPVGDAVTAAGALPDGMLADGMPADGTHPDGMAIAGGPDLAADGAGTPLPVDGRPMTADEPTVHDALAVLRDYYAAINDHRYDAAYRLWSDDGKASGKTALQFANGFEDTATVDILPGEAGRVDAAAGSRFVRIPLSITALRVDGSEHRYIGSYTLRRAVVDGASPEQRAWRIASADIREVAPQAVER